MGDILRGLGLPFLFRQNAWCRICSPKSYFCRHKIDILTTPRSDFITMQMHFELHTTKSPDSTSCVSVLFRIFKLRFTGFIMFFLLLLFLPFAGTAIFRPRGLCWWRYPRQRPHFSVIIIIIIIIVVIIIITIIIIISVYYRVYDSDG